MIEESQKMIKGKRNRGEVREGRIYYSSSISEEATGNGCDKQAEQDRVESATRDWRTGGSARYKDHGSMLAFAFAGFAQLRSTS